MYHPSPDKYLHFDMLYDRSDRVLDCMFSLSIHVCIHNRNRLRRQCMFHYLSMG
ncbi:hypothetical protein X975_07897, partial [Stegodyphus mimosarum]